MTRLGTQTLLVASQRRDTADSPTIVELCGYRPGCLSHIP